MYVNTILDNTVPDFEELRIFIVTCILLYLETIMVTSIVFLKHVILDVFL